LTEPKSSDPVAVLLPGALNCGRATGSGWRLRRAG
jgi:hypothetical protein